MNSLLVGKISELPIRISIAGRSLRLLKLLRELPGRREVWQAESDHGLLVLKCFSDDASGKRDFRRELAGFQGWQSRGIASPQLLFHQQKGPALLAAEWLEGESALEVYKATRDDSRRQKLCTELLRFVAGELAAGCEQTDIHLGNFQRSARRWMVLDAAACKFTDGPVPADRVQSNLAGLLAQFRIDIARAVIEHQPDLAVAVNWAELAKKHLRITRKRHSRAAAKSLRNCTEFAVINCGDLVGMARRSDWALIESMAHSGLDAAMASGRSLKQGGSATVVKVTVQGRELVIKRYNTKSAGHRIKKWVTRSRAKKSWLNAVWLRSAEIGTPLPIAFFEQRGIGTEGVAYFIAEPADGPDLLAVSEALLIQAGVAALLASLVRKMRLLGFSHGDFKGTNLILENDGLLLIDLDSMRRELKDRQCSKLIDEDVRRLCRNWDDGPFKSELLEQLDLPAAEAGS